MHQWPWDTKERMEVRNAREAGREPLDIILQRSPINKLLGGTELLLQYLELFLDCSLEGPFPPSLSRVAFVIWYDLIFESDKKESERETYTIFFPITFCRKCVETNLFHCIPHQRRQNQLNPREKMKEDIKLIDDSLRKLTIVHTTNSMYELFERVDTNLTELFVFDGILTGSKLNFSFHVNYYSSSRWYFVVKQSSTKVELIVYITCQLTQH